MKRFFLFLAFCFCLSALGQEPVYHQFTPNNGLPSNETYDLAADSAGYIWIGTDRGLARFDGRNFKIFTVNDGLTDNVIDRIVVSPGGRVWAMGKNNILHSLQGNRFVKYRLADDLAALIRPGYFGYLFHIHFIQEEPVCFATNTHGFLWVKNNRILIEQPTAFNKLHINAHGTAAALYQDFTGNYNSARSRILYFQGKPYTQEFNFFMRPSLVHRPGGDMLLACGRWIFTLRHGVVVAEDSLESPIMNFYADKAGNIWACLLHKGVRKFAAGTPVIPGNKGVLYFPDDRITDMVQDYEGGYWFTTYTRGVLFMPDPNVECYQQPLDLPDKGFAEITGDGAGRIFLATQSKHLFRMENGHISLLTSLPEKRPRPICQSLHYDTSHNILIVPCSDGTFTVNGITGETQAFSISSKSFCANSSGKMVTLIGQGFVKHYNLETGDSVLYPSGEDYFSVSYDRDDQCWVGGHNGLFRYDGKQVFASSINVRINSIKQLDNGLIVMATLGKGLALLRKGQSPRYLSLGPSAQQNLVNDLEVSGNIVWAATERGLFKVNLSDEKTPRISIWSVETGFPWNDIRRVHIQSGKVYVITQNKLIAIDKSAFHLNLRPPGIFLNKIMVNDSLSLSPDSTAHLPYTSSRFKFFFNGIAFRSGSALRYQYRLIGVDDHWHTVAQPLVEIPFLAPGNYRFELVALNEDNVRSITPVIYSFSIARPFWEQWWFLSGILVFTTLLAGIFVRNRFLREKQRNQEREMSLQYEQQALSAQINPHFIFNVLNSVQNFILQEDKPNAIKYLRRFSKLMRMNLENARHKWVTPEDELQLLEAYLELQKLRYKDKFTYSVQTAGNSATLIQIPSMLIQPFVENAIMHGMNNLAGRSGIIEVWITYEKHMVRCIVEDNGIGREKAWQLRKHHRESAGINITRERLQLLWTETGTTPFFQVIDKLDDQGNAAGTKVIFSLPYKKVDSPFVTP